MTVFLLDGCADSIFDRLFAIDIFADLICDLFC